MKEITCRYLVLKILSNQSSDCAAGEQALRLLKLGG